MKKIKWNDVRLVLILVAVIFLFSFSSKRNEKRKFIEADIQMIDNESFLDIDVVNKLLIQSFGSVKNIPKDKLDLNSVEKSIDNHPMVEKAEVFKTIDGKLKAIVKQKQPVGRVYVGSVSYYIDYNGGKMPLSENFTARVPLITGEIEKLENEVLAKLLKYIYEDDFLKKDIIGIEVRPSGRVRLKSRSYNYEILFGKVINVEKKFNNYKAFFHNAVKDTMIENYKTINLKFTQQVVCTKN